MNIFISNFLLISIITHILVATGYAEDSKKPCSLIGDPAPASPPNGFHYDSTASDPEFQQRVNNALAVLGTTPRGKELIDCLSNTGLDIVTDNNGNGGAGAPGQVNPTDGKRGPGIIKLDGHDKEGIGKNNPHRDQLPSACEDHPDNSDDGGGDDPCREAKDLAVVLAHELGHACGEGEEDEEDGGKNVEKNENPVRASLGLCKRTKYGETPVK